MFYTTDATETPRPLSGCGIVHITASSLSLACQRPETAAAFTTLYRAEVTSTFPYVNECMNEYI